MAEQQDVQVSNLDQLVTPMQNGNQVLAQILKVLKSAFATITGTASSATAGAATLPANPVGFIVITLPDGTSAKVAYYT